MVEVFLFYCHNCLLRVSIHPSLLLFQDIYCWPAFIYLVFWVHIYSYVPPIYDDRLVLVCACVCVLLRQVVCMCVQLNFHITLKFNRLLGICGVPPVRAEDLLHC